MDSRPFTVAAWCGERKPPSIDEYAEKLIEEALDLQENGIELDGKKYRVKLVAIICDSPARCFVKKCKAHNGKGGCERCTQRGSRRNKTWTYQDINADKRTDESFRNMQHSDHHRGRSPFTHLKLDMVRNFPIDYMHLVCLGVVKKFLLMLYESFSVDQITLFNQRTEQFKEAFTVEFQRKGRKIEHVANWKATEYRHFLLYSGIFILKGLISDEQYNH